MAVSFAFRQAMKNRTRRSRRIEVLCFFGLMALALSFAGEPFRVGQLGLRFIPYVFVIGSIFRTWKFRGLIPVTSLDDRAKFEFGAEFDRLTEAQQHDLLRRYRVGTYYMNYFPDELQATQEAEAQVRAYSLMRLSLLPLAALYWLGWLWLPQGRFRAGWTDAPTVLVWVVLLVLALPQLIQMWSEPDDVGELRIVEEKEV